MLDTAQKDLADTATKLHATDKARHETEMRWLEEKDQGGQLSQTIKDKDDQLLHKTRELEDLDKKHMELVRQNEQLDTKKQGVERQYELSKKQLNEKISNLTEVLAGEKETRQQWVERFEKEQKDNNIKTAQLQQSRAEHRDQMLATKNAEIAQDSLKKQTDVLTRQNASFQE